ncbi:TetR/AcrR family transcriptional regulator C-terminal domain-containing protein [Nocardioides sp. AE5]|uniref:TetR/AcrR family transcriptional regulator n=1 Tax=Nocardioides sp. AE5 TaxID=2962573 RepID=UPI0028812D35|nr:TetR/AcrR family transcriptional regulator C-terminal domain-containing protein [Nocardioides sp. AE5]MDT0201739.1 TetR/AcrR family transcriptional regulator C-terminal domain-containing protein [Nocardioides sp. AE5]
MSYWSDPKPVRRTRAVTVDDVAREAVVLLDEGGIPAVTIRSLAGRVGVAAPSLYSRIRSVDDILDLGLDHALDGDRQVWRAAETGSPHELLLALYDHLCRHRWAAQVIGLRAPRGPAYLRFSERLLILLLGQGVEDPLSAAYAMSNFVIGSATTAASATDEPKSPVDHSLAPTYSRLHAGHAVDPRTIVDAGLRALTSAVTGRT